MKTSKLMGVCVPSLLLCAALLLNGCESASPDPASPYSFPARVGQMAFGTANEALPSALDMHEAVSAVKSAVNAAESWEDAHARVSETLGSLPSQQRAVAEQFAAAAMINSPLTQEPTTSRSAEVTAHYLGLLARHGSPEAQLYEKGIAFAESYLSESDVAHLVDTAVEHARITYADEPPCEDCSESASGLPDHVRAMQESVQKETSHADEVRAAAERLSRLPQPSL